MRKYTIYRFYAKEGKNAKVIKTGVSLKEAREHCNREDTHKVGKWFDGYQRED